MSFEQKDNSGSLWKNKRKETDKHPDRTGSAMIGGVEYWISGWIKEHTDKETGEKQPWLSLAFKKKEEKQRQPPHPKPPAPEEDNSEIPF